MKQTQYLQLQAAAFCGFIFLLLACNSVDKGKKEMPGAETPDTSSSSAILLQDNEVKAEAPDADGKKEQGYAFPKNTRHLAQSPIDIIAAKADNTGKEQMAFSFHSDIETAENLGHTVELEFKEGSKCTVNGKDYAARQFHFHTPSEHLLDGATYPMEMHIVNVLYDTANKDHYLVVAILFKMGAENKFLKEFLDKIPTKEGEKTALHTGEVKLEDLIAQFTSNDIKSYYTYDGSLTTPPFTESVRWVVMKHLVEASENQILAVEKIEGNNARHVQAINNRKVYSW